MRRLLASLGACLASLAVAPAALGQTFVEVGGNGVRQVSAVQTTMQVTGTVSVDFHGDPDAGCAEVGLCDIAGNVTWDPSGRGSVFAYGYRAHGQRFEGSLASFGDGDDDGSRARTSARVRRSGSGGLPGGLCADALVPAGSPGSLGDRSGSSTEIGLIADPAGFLGTDTFRTRCTGPGADDLRALLPTHVVSERFLRRGHAQLDFSAERSFSAGGLAGTLHSDVVLHLGRSQDQFQDQTGTGPTHKYSRRAIDVHYRIESVSGQVVTSVHGLADPDLCGPLDACGLMGTVTTAPSVSSGSAQLSAESSAGHSRAELQRAVGLRSGGRPRGVQAFGYVQWPHDNGTITSALSRGATSACSASRPMSGPGALVLVVRGRQVSARYGSTDGLPADAVRTRCPGPSAADIAGSSTLAQGTLPLTAFGRRRVTLRLTRGRSFRSDGYGGSTSSDLTIVLRRTRVRQYVQTYDVPNEFKPRLP